MSTITELPSALPLITSSRQFLDSEQHIVDFILANTDRAPQMTSAQLARASSTSEASVSRFCKKLGFKNYRSFQFSLARDLAAREGDERVTGEVTLDDIEQSLANIKHAKQREIEATLDALDPDTLRRLVVDLFRRAGLVMFAAVGNTNAVAIDAAIKFGQLGIRCVANTITESSTSLALTMGKDDVLVLEGIHGLNEKLTWSLPSESKFRIYISALTQINVDEHNRIPTTDGRLIRRMVRDSRTRATSAKETIARRGSEYFSEPGEGGCDVQFSAGV